MYYLDNKELITLFPTPLFKGKVNDKSLCDDIARKLRSHRTLKKGSFEAKNFISTDMLQDDPEFGELSSLVMRESEAVLDWYGVKRESHYISNMWGNITNPNHRHPVHMHPNCLLSGLIYIATPENCGGTAFVDPRPAARMFEPNYHQMTEWNSGMFLNFPEQGTMLFWPSWLTHGVERGFNKNNEDRIVVAFNIMIRAKIETMTAKLELK